MDLREYLFRHNMTATEFARRIDYERTYISSCANGTIQMGKKLARIIEAETNGMVTRQEALDTYRLRQKKLRKD